MSGADAVVAKLFGLALDRGVAVRAPVERTHGVAALTHGAGPAVALGDAMVGDGNVCARALDADTHGSRWRGRRLQ